MRFSRPLFAVASVSSALVAWAIPLAAQTRELNAAEQVAHVLSRLTFGARPGDAERVAAIGVDAWIAAQLRPAPAVDTTAVAALAALPAWATPIDSLPSLKPASMLVKPKPVLVTTRDSAGSKLADQRVMMVQALRTVTVRLLSFRGAAWDLSAGKIIMAESNERQLYEVVTDFWENHFSVYGGKMPSAGALPWYVRDAIRPHALGKFRDLLGAVAHSPAMLYYLDNHISTASGLNENYGRELLELHTLGVDGGYTQKDVVEAARALTGWSIDPPVAQVARLGGSARFVFRADAHDMKEKTILGRRFAAQRGIEDGEELLDMLARHPSTARHIATKLARRLVSDDPPASVIERAAATFIKTDGDIAEVVRSIVTSDEFFSRAAFRSKVKTPFELVVSARRSLGAPADTTEATVALLTRLNQPVFGYATPEGWPDVASAWVNPGSLIQRMLLGSEAAAGSVKELPLSRWEGFPALMAKPPAEQADGVVRLILGGVATPATRDALASIRGADGAARLRDMLGVALASPDFQRR